MLNTSLKFSAPPARRKATTESAPTLSVHELDEARSKPAGITLGATLAAAATVALSLAPQAQAQTVIEQPMPTDMFGMQMHAQMQQMQQMANQYRVGPPITMMKGRMPQGTMIIGDAFGPMGPGQNAHGSLVSQAGQEQGFQGLTVTYQQSTSLESRQSQSAFQNLGTPGLSKEDARKSIGEFARLTATGTVNDQIDAVQQATDSGARNSVLNLSMGTSKARLSGDLLFEASFGWNNSPTVDRELADTVLDNFARAFDLSSQRLKSEDPSVSGPERQKLQQGVADLVGRSLDSSTELAQAKKEWAEAVNTFEAGNNSVVVSAGNQGTTLKDLSKQAHGHKLNVPADFETSVLETPAVTSVGATRWYITGETLTERVADYNSNATGIDIYASGSVDSRGGQEADTWGTSFSAPRVSVTMAELHRQNPEMNSDQVEALMKKDLTHELNSGNGTVTVLDYKLAADFLATGEPVNLAPAAEQSTTNSAVSWGSSQGTPFGSWPSSPFGTSSK